MLPETYEELLDDGTALSDEEKEERREAEEKRACTTVGSRYQARKREAVRYQGEAQDDIAVSRKSGIGNTSAIEVYGEDDGRRRLTLVEKETGAPILQRISATNLNLLVKIRKSASEGLELYTRYEAAIRGQNGKKRGKAGGGLRRKRRVAAGNVGNVIGLLGLWHSQSNGYFGWTRDSRRGGDPAARLQIWVSRHCWLMHQCIVRKLDPRLRGMLRRRLAVSKNFLPKLVARHELREMFHPWWTTIAVFDGTTTGTAAHQDIQDDSPSLLFNFGCEVMLELPEFCAAIRIRPLEVIVLDAKRYLHATKVVGAGRRWAIGVTYRQSIADRRVVTTYSTKRLQLLASSITTCNGRQNVRVEGGEVLESEGEAISSEDQK